MSDDLQEPEGEGEEGEGRAVEILPPRANPALIGHEGAEALLLQAHLAGRLPHALLIGGRRGIGKATLAFRLARFLLAEAADGQGLLAAPPTSLAVDPGHPVFRRVAAGGHADLLTVERGFDPKRKRLRSEIVVEDVRGIGGFLRLTPAERGWRIVVLDGADLMNRNAANAVLKILEEPPRRSLILLVSDNPGRLLPTIRSRCRRLMLKPLATAEVTRLLAEAHPRLAPAEAAALARLAQGSIGQALELAASGGLGLYRSLVQLIAGLPALDAAALHAFADRLARAEALDAYRMATELLTGWLARMIALAAHPAQWSEEASLVPGEGEAMRRLAARRGLDQWVEVWEKITHLLAQADGLNLDRKQVVLNAFFALEEAAR